MKTIILDFDGTIADTFPVVLAIFHRVSRRKTELSSAEAVLLRKVALRQVKGRAILRHAAELRVPWWHVPVLFLVCRLLLDGRMREVQPMPGMYGVIKTLHENGYTIAIASSNSEKNIDVFLRKEHLRSYVSYIVGNIRSSRKGKALRRMKRLDRSVFKGAIMVGDEERDIAAAKEAKLKSIAVTWGYNNTEQLAAARPDFIVDSAEKLLGTIQKHVK
jgi:phosphoglycolate phosphatase